MQIPTILITRPMTGVAGLDVATSDKYIRFLSCGRNSTETTIE